MLPSILAREVQSSLKDQLRASFAPTTKSFDRLIEDFAGAPDTLIKGPWLTLELPFRRAKADIEFFPDMPLGFRAYSHQEKAFRRLSGDHPRSSIVATGTGSGKTECFLYPILDACIRSKGQRGVKAIVIYPMNALAADQARRIAALRAKTPALDGVRVGIYADERPVNPSDEMTPTDVITSRQALINDPPDVLLTNYKMLDYMLLRPDERELWSGNLPETLRYLVVDELHTFDGAQGTDLASLIRRLKSRLGMPKGTLCCVGTSATLGGQEAIPDLLAYAGRVFDESFDKDAIIVEDRQSVAEYLDGIDVEYAFPPSAPEVRRLVEEASDVGPAALIAATYSAWFGAPVPDLDETDAARWRASLGDRLNRHAFLQRLLEVTQGRPSSYGDLRSELRRAPEFRNWADDDLDAVLDTFASLVAHARRGEATNVKSLRPFLNVRTQLWVRELRRMVATLSETPVLLHHDDLGEAEQKTTLPVVHCRACGGAGWATEEPNDARKSLGAEPSDVYKAYFGYSDRLRFLFREAPAIRNIGGLNTIEGLVCSACLSFHTNAAGKSECPSCRGKDTLLTAHKLMPGRFTGANFRVDHDCPFCGNPSGMGILGAQSATLVTGMVATIFGSEFNDDPKLLTFSDSVQDAAHRAAILQARNATSVFRKGLSRFVCEEFEPSLSATMKQATGTMRTGQTSEEDFVATYIPADMQWRHDYVALLKKDALPDASHMSDHLMERLSWETFAELTFRGRLGATIERLGVAVAHVDMNLAISVAQALTTRLADELGETWKDVDATDVRLFLLGMLDHMRSQGAVANPITRMFAEREARWYSVYKGLNGGRHSLPNYGPSSPKPVLPSNTTISGFENCFSEATGSWYGAWFHTCFGRQAAFLPSRADFYGKVFELLTSHGLVERMKIANNKVEVIAAWGLLPDKVKVFSTTSLVRCGACGNSHRVPEKYAALWSAMPCTRAGCGGRMNDALESKGSRSRARLLTTGRIKRVVAAEHTSLLDREARKQVETRFMDDGGRPWYPNLLSATPTLEMGINIGDLSTLILCSVPPEQANYVQRIGRAGRRDGNALNLTIATGRPHDMWYWADPAEMISGQVKTPGVHLEAVAILRRQFAAFTLDRWVAEEGAGVASYGKVGDALKAIKGVVKDRFPLYWLEFVEMHATRLFEAFVRLFPELSDRDSLANLHEFAHGGAQDGLAHLVAQEYQSAQTEIASIGKRIDESKKATNKLKKKVPPDLDLADRLRDLDRERRALRSIRKDIENGDNLAFLTDRGILPNYAFPEAGVTLKSILYRAEAEGDDARVPTVNEYVRSAGSALSEFAPGASFYVQGRRLKIDQIDLSASPIEHWRVCPDCIHIERAETETTEAACPSCGSQMWADVGSRRPMVRLRQVSATGTDRSTRIPEDGDDRDRKPMDRDYLPAIERDQIAFAYAIEEDDTPFAFEFLRRCTFREVNFGESKDAPTGQRIGGERRRGHGFQVCKDCGRVQDASILRRLTDTERTRGLHAPGCKQATGEGEDRFAEVLYVYREFSSEAIRLLLPFASDRQGSEVTSLRAAIDLGLRLHFKGRVSHLRSTLVETKEGPLTRRYLYLYDSVPGGTGYLKQIATRTDDLYAVFAAARDHMISCVCNQDSTKDGCPRCIRSHAATFGRGEISRNSAVRQINQILVGWPKLRPIATVSDVKLNKALESELEQMFVERLRAEVKKLGGAFRKTIVGGNTAYAIKLGTQSWMLEPQCWLREHFAEMPTTRADMVFWPAVPTPGVKPVAVYLDGWAFHEHSVAEDLALRQKIVRTGKMFVWSATWDDIASAGEPGAPKHYWEPQSRLEGSVRGLKDGDDLVSDAQEYADKSPFDQFLDVLAGPEPAKWLARARTVATSWFVQGMKARKPPAAIGALLEELAGPEAKLTLTAVEPDATITHLDWGNRIVVVAAPKTWRPPEWSDTDGLTVALGFEHRLAKTSEAKRSWAGALRAMNLLQFLPYFYVGCAQSVAPLAALRTTGAPIDDAWAEVEDSVLSEVLPLVQALREVGVPAPVPLFEAVGGDGVVLGTFEFAWPGKQVGVVTNEADVPKFARWKVLVFAPGNDLVGVILESLR